MSTTPQPTRVRQRMTREDRRRQLLDVAWGIAGDQGADAVTLGRLAEKAGVTKPVVYSHFPRRDDLLLALYREFDDDQSARLDAALESADTTLAARAEALSDCYLSCFLSETRRIPGVSAALDVVPELSRLKAECERRYAERFRSALAPFAPSRTVSQAALRAVIGAADGVSRAAASGEISEPDARSALSTLIQSAIHQPIPQGRS